MRRKFMMWLLRLARVDTAVLIPSSTGSPLVHFTYRHYPFAIVPGDALWMWKWRIDQIAKLTESTSDEELRFRVQELQEKIHATFNEYNATCKENHCGGFKEGEAPW